MSAHHLVTLWLCLQWQFKVHTLGLLVTSVNDLHPLLSGRVLGHVVGWGDSHFVQTRGQQTPVIPIVG